MMEVLKATLSYRHTVRYIRRDDEQIVHADRILQKVLQDLKKQNFFLWFVGKLLKVAAPLL
jgi:hypothetical protein